MKPIQIYLLLGMLAYFTNSAAQKTNPADTTISFRVEGVCGQCKARIENAALIKGVKFAEWDRDTEVLKAIYRSDRVTAEEIHKALAAAGHDTESEKAPEAAYKKLPRCCAYRDGVHKH